jgi:hypothetical protein
MAAKKTKPIICWINHGVYPGSTMFIYKKSHDEVCKHLKKLKAIDWLVCVENDELMLKPEQWFCGRRVFYNSKTKEERTLFFIRIATEFYFNDRAYVTLAHEVLHLCQFFLPDLMDRNKEIEAEAYFHTYMMEQCLKAIRGEAK